MSEPETIETMRARIVVLSAEIEARTAELEELREKQLALVVKMLPDPPKYTVFADTDWGCTNPANLCVYDASEDPCHDFCLFCHQPEERK